MLLLVVVAVAVEQVAAVEQVDLEQGQISLSLLVQLTQLLLVVAEVQGQEAQHPEILMLLVAMELTPSLAQSPLLVGVEVELEMKGQIQQAKMVVLVVVQGEAALVQRPQEMETRPL